MIDLDAIRARWGNLVITARGMTFSGDDEPDFPAAVLAIGDLIAEVERLRADATRAEADLTEDCTRLMRERDEARAEVERLRGSSEHEAMLAAYLDAAENAGWGTR